MSSPTKTPPGTPLANLTNRETLRTMDRHEITPVGDRDKTLKIQLCIELRNKEIKKIRRNSKDRYELVLEVSVMYLKNLPKRQIQGSSKTFVKISLIPGNIIHSTELKIDTDSKQMVNLDFVEVFAFSLESKADLKGKVMKILVCDKKMTRNASVFGQAEIPVENLRLGEPLCKWFSLTSSGTEDNNNQAA